MTMMSSYFGNLLFITLDTPEGSNVISIDKAIFFLLSLGVGESSGKSPEYEFSRKIHYLINGSMMLINFLSSIQPINSNHN
jgi:hypothetical protein